MEVDRPTYEQVLELERQLDQRAEILIGRVNYLCRLVRQRNRERWEKFARTARLPVVGEMYFQIFRAPVDLEQEPEYRKMEWYVKESKAIENGAKKLEELKAADMEHWGDEMVQPCDLDYTSSMITRRKCYSRCCGGLGLRAFIADKYDFSSGTAADRLKDGAYVMDMVTKEVVPFNKCNWRCGELEGDGVTLRLAEKYARSRTTYTHRK